jgi:2-hydroxy-3-oxopropionate reductase
MKLVVNMIMGGMMAIFCEGLALGQKAGLKAVDILEVIDAGAMSNPLFLLKGGLIGKKDYTVAFPLKHLQRDLRLAVLLGDMLNQPLFSAAAANEAFKKAMELGALVTRISPAYIKPFNS